MYYQQFHYSECFLFFLFSIRVNGKARSTNLYVGGNLGIGTTTPTEKVEIKDRPIAIVSTADATHWQIAYNEAQNWFDFRENGIFRMLVRNGGNVSISNIANTYKLTADASLAGSVSAGGGGLLANTIATQLKMATHVSLVAGSNIAIVANSCSKLGFGFVNGTFSAPPTVMIGHKLTDSTADNHLAFSISNVTTIIATLNVYNNSATDIALNGYSYSCTAIGQ